MSYEFRDSDESDEFIRERLARMNDVLAELDNSPLTGEDEIESLIKDLNDITHRIEALYDDDMQRACNRMSYPEQYDIDGDR